MHREHPVMIGDHEHEEHSLQAALEVWRQAVEAVTADVHRVACGGTPDRAATAALLEEVERARRHCEELVPLEP